MAPGREDGKGGHCNDMEGNGAWMRKEEEAQRDLTKAAFFCNLHLPTFSATRHLVMNCQKLPYYPTFFLRMPDGNVICIGRLYSIYERRHFQARDVLRMAAPV